MQINTETKKILDSILKNKAYRKDEIVITSYPAVKAYNDYVLGCKAIFDSVHHLRSTDETFIDPITATKVHGRMLDSLKERFQANFRIYKHELIEAANFISSKEFFHPNG